MTYYKAVRPSGHDFHTGTVFWAVGPGEIVHHPTSTLPPDEWGTAADYLSAATTPTDCTGMKWPARLFEVEPVGPVGTPEPYSFPHRRGATAWRVVREVDPRRALGPQGEALAEFLDALRDLTGAEVEAMAAAGGAVPGVAWGVPWRAGRYAAAGAAGAAGGIAGGALRALVVADLVGQYGLTRDHLDTLTAPARVVPRLAAIIDRALPTATKEN